MNDKIEGDLRVSIEHGGQRVTFDSPAGDEGNPVIEGEDEFGGILDTIKKPFKKAGRAAGKVVSAPAREVEKAVDVERFALNASRAAGHGAHSLVKVTNHASGVIEHAARKIPVVGKPLSKTIGASREPAKFADAVASGERIDQAVLESVKRSARDARELAPYAQVVAASVPGVGTGVAAGIAGGAALAEGRSINDAAVQAARAAIPGGPVAQAAFDAAMAAGRGESPAKIAEAAALSQLPADQRTAARAAMEIASAAAKGKPMDKAALSATRHALDAETADIAGAWIGKPGANAKMYDALTRGLPPHVRRAMTSGTALGFAQESQRDLHAAITAPEARDRLLETGKAAIAKSEVLRHAQSQVPDAEAFALGTGLVQHSEVPRMAVLYLRDQMKKGRTRLSFDAAIATHVGAVTTQKFSKGTDHKHKVGYYSVAGSLAGSEEQRAGIVRILARKDAAAMRGAALAVRNTRRRRSWWRRLVAWLKAEKKKS